MQSPQYLPRWNRRTIAPRLLLSFLGVNSNFLNLQSVEPTGPLSSGSSEAEGYLETQLELLKSDSLVARAVKKTHLDESDRFIFHQSGPMRWAKSLVASIRGTSPYPRPATEAERLRWAVESAQRRLKVEQIHQSNLVEISFEDPDPKTALGFVNAVTDEAVSEGEESHLALSHDVREWLERHLADLRAKMDAAEKDLLTYTAQAGLLASSDSAGVDDARLQHLQDELSQAQSVRIQKETLNTIATMADPQSLPEVLDDPVMKEYRMRLADLRKQEAEIASTFTPKFPKARRLQAQIKELQATMAKEVTNIRNRIYNEYAASKRNENAVLAEYTSETSKVGSLAQKTIHYNTLKRELETTRGMYEDTLKRVNDTELASVVRSSGLRVVDQASFVEPQTGLKAMFICSIGLFTGLMMSGAVVFVLDQTSDTVSMPGYTPALLSVMELGTIPSAGKKERSLLAAPQSRAGLSGGNDGAPGASLLTLRQQARLRSKGGGGVSLFEDSFRSSINSILFALDEGAEHRVIAISSPGPAEGKTTVTANLGNVLAGIGNRVLLIDADLRKPSLHKLFGIENTMGLANLLSRDEPISRDGIRARVARPAAAHLDVLTAGTHGDAAFELFHSKRIAELIDLARRDYNLILIDTAPLLVVPESRLLGRLADWSILVLRAGRTTGDAALAARQRMADDRIPLLGTILNDCKRRRNSNGYWY